jgi:hypothetical protein
LRAERDVNIKAGNLRRFGIAHENKLPTATDGGERKSLWSRNN